MATQITPRIDGTVILRDENNYQTWLSQLQARCAAYDVWTKVDPNSTTTPLAKRREPELPEFSAYTPNANVGGDDVPERLSDLSTAGQKAYKEDLDVYKLHMERYKLRLSEYKAEKASLQQIVMFIQSTVTPHLQRTCCLPDTTLKEWVTKLKATVGVDAKLELQHANERYQAALKPPRTPAS
ncbi:hypothetical protein DM02DRAFT_696302 [Periconia macrospinosa]|uniref:DUF4219 domain-containing protein n=1 Tax=Periconia macrospinosa TaxID=97972 RepID=A0A2V1D5Q1_9PLEO|nr:hypothetical protein DM02DRAFT_696302 [Periconia macrospinosa]